MKSILYIIFSYPLFIIGQNKNLNKYIPYETTSYITHPIIEIKVWAHIIQKNEKNTQNFTKDSTDIIKQHFKWINDIYASLNPPTLSNSKGIKPFIKDSRIRFNLDTITFHVNEYDWDRLKIVPEEKNSKIVIDGGKIYSPTKNWKGIKVINIKKRKKGTHTSPLIELLNNGEIIY